MNFEEHSAKPLLAEHGLQIARGILVNSSKAAQQAVRELGGACVLKAQVPTGKRGKAGGIQLVNNPQEAAEQAERILGMEIAGYKVEQLLVEPQIDIAAEYYAAVLNDPRSKAPLVIFSAQGGMDIEEVAAANPAAIRQQAVDIRSGFDKKRARALLGDLLTDELAERVATSLAQLYSCYSAIDAELLEVNPLVVTTSGELLALDCKYVLDDSAIKRQPDLAAQGAPELLSDLETKGNEAGIKYIELDGNIGVLANGAGLTMTTMDVIAHYGGKPANFCEIGGEAYTKAQTALELVLGKPGVRSLVVNFCGAFARCDVMMSGLLAAWQQLQPDIPVFFSIAGTGDSEAIGLLQEQLGMQPLADMDAACQAAVRAAAE